MKKKIFRILAAAMIISLLSIQAIYAEGGLTIQSIYPEDGETGIQTTNQMARIVFSEDIDIKANEGYFKIVDMEGKEQPIMVLEQPDDPKRINLVLEKNLDQSAEYKIIIDGEVTGKDGNKLGEDAEFLFKTRNAKTDSIVTTVMMVVMMAAIIIFTVRDQAKKQREANEANGNKQEKVNPYKEAKKEAEKIRARKQKEKKQKVAEQMEKNRNKANAKNSKNGNNKSKK